MKDAVAIARLVDLYAQGHPAQSVSRPAERIAPFYVGDRAIGRVLLAEADEIAMGFLFWRRAYDMYWNKEGGEILAVYVEPAYRGLGVAMTLVASACRDIRDAGGEFLWASYAHEHAALYERVALGAPDSQRWGYVAARAFHRMADLAGATPRKLLQMLPDTSWNKDLGPG